MLSFFQRDVLGEIFDLNESVSGVFRPTLAFGSALVHIGVKRGRSRGGSTPPPPPIIWRGANIPFAPLPIIHPHLPSVSMLNSRKIDHKCTKLICVPFISFEGTSESILFNFIRNFAILSVFNVRNVFDTDWGRGAPISLSPAKSLPPPPHTHTHPSILNLGFPIFIWFIRQNNYNKSITLKTRTNHSKTLNIYFYLFSNFYFEARQRAKWAAT